MIGRFAHPTKKINRASTKVSAATEVFRKADDQLITQAEALQAVIAAEHQRISEARTHLQLAELGLRRIATLRKQLGEFTS